MVENQDVPTAEDETILKYMRGSPFSQPGCLVRGRRVEGRGR